MKYGNGNLNPEPPPESINYNKREFWSEPGAFQTLVLHEVALNLEILHVYMLKL